jgi:multisubunit Na+/H+ antiporter MnhG subunit
MRRILYSTKFYEILSALFLIGGLILLFFTSIGVPKIPQRAFFV